MIASAHFMALFSNFRFMKTLLLLWLSPITLLLGDPAASPTPTTGKVVVTSAGNISATDDQELAQAYLGALKANPELQDRKKRLSDQLRTAIAAGQPPGEDLRKAELAYQQALQAAMRKIDPNVGIILDKMGAKSAQWAMKEIAPTPTTGTVVVASADKQIEVRGGIRLTERDKEQYREFLVREIIVKDFRNLFVFWRKRKQG
jgi:hypothetical protein